MAEDFTVDQEPEIESRLAGQIELVLHHIVLTAKKVDLSTRTV